MRSIHFVCLIVLSLTTCLLFLEVCFRLEASSSSPFSVVRSPIHFQIIYTLAVLPTRRRLSVFAIFTFVHQNLAPSSERSATEPISFSTSAKNVTTPSRPLREFGEQDGFERPLRLDVYPPIILLQLGEQINQAIISVKQILKFAKLTRRYARNDDTVFERRIYLMSYFFVFTELL